MLGKETVKSHAFSTARALVMVPLVDTSRTIDSSVIAAVPSSTRFVRLTSIVNRMSFLLMASS